MRKIIVFIILILSLTLIYARYVEPTRLVTKEISIKSDNLPSSFTGLKIVHFSDLHYGKNIDIDYLSKIITEINTIDPDIVVFTGDLISNNTTLNDDDITILKKKLEEINSKYGKYTILGNKDKKYKDKLIEIYAYSNFILLENSYNIIYNKDNESIFIGGVSPYSSNESNIDDVMNYFKQNPDISYKIILIHEPDYVDQIINNYNDISLILGGHSHGGQITIPYLTKYYNPKLARKYNRDYYKLNNTDFYISSGIGNTKINLRLFNPPEINLYRVTNN